MAYSVNKVTLLGHVAKDPEMKISSNGKKMATFTVATSESWKNKLTGERQSKVEWHSIIVFNEGLISIIDSSVRKGLRVYIEGSLSTKKWHDDNGVPKSYTVVVLQGYACTLVILPKNTVDGTNDKDSEYDDGSSDVDDALAAANIGGDDEVISEGKVYDRDFEDDELPF